MAISTPTTRCQWFKVLRQTLVELTADAGKLDGTPQEVVQQVMEFASERFVGLPPSIKTDFATGLGACVKASGGKLGFRRLTIAERGFGDERQVVVWNAQYHSQAVTRDHAVPSQRSR